MMNKNDKSDSQNSTHYIRSNNAGNTIDNTQRHTKPEDPLNSGYTNPPIGNKEQGGATTTSDADENINERI